MRELEKWKYHLELGEWKASETDQYQEGRNEKDIKEQQSKGEEVQISFKERGIHEIYEKGALDPMST